MKRHESQRGWFAFDLYQRMKTDKRLVLVVADLGYKVFDSIRMDFPEQFLNTGASEQVALDICVSLSLSGKIPVFYTITPFILRGFETLRTYINHENIKVILVGSGRNKNYEKDGISHWASDISTLFRPLLNLMQYYPKNKEEVPLILDTCIQRDGPSFISLER